MELTKAVLDWNNSGTSRDGVILEIYGNLTYSRNISKLQMNVFGDFWKLLPGGIETIARMTYLPLELVPSYMSSTQCNAPRFNLSISLGTKERGTIGVGRETIRKQLETMIAGGDPFILMEFQTSPTDEKPLFSFFTKPSLLLNSLNSNNLTGSRRNNNNVIYSGPTPTISKPSALRVYLRWWLLPVLFTLFVLYCALFPANQWFPAIFTRGNVTIGDLLPPHPTSMHQAWKLSQIDYQAFELEKNDMKDPKISELLKEASVVLGKSQPITIKQLHGIEKRIIEIENTEGIIQRVYGFFTFVNIIWLVAIFGIIISVGPCMAVIIRPVWKYIEMFLKWFFHQIIIPMHNLGIFEIIAYMGCALFVSEGQQHHPDSGFYISLTGLLLVIPAVLYSTFLHAKIPQSSIEAVYPVFGLWLSLTQAIMAIYYDSTLLGWFCVLEFYQALGFSVLCGGLCYFIGFSSKDGLIRVAVTSFLLLTCWITLRLISYSTLKTIYLRPFGSPVQIFGSITLLLALLLVSSRYYYHYQSNSYPLRQIPIIAILVIELAIGNIFGMQSLANTATVFLVLYGIEKMVDIMGSLDNGWVLIFGTSFFMYRFALFLHQNPEYITSLFDAEL